jgi:hypothetical protein
MNHFFHTLVFHGVLDKMILTSKVSLSLIKLLAQRQGGKHLEIVVLSYR